MYNPYHVIHHLLPARRELVYNIRQRHHDMQLTTVSGQLRNRNFIHRMLFKDCYWLYHIRRLRNVIQLLLSVSKDFYHRCFNRFVLCRCVLSFCRYETNDDDDDDDELKDENSKVVSNNQRFETKNKIFFVFSWHY